MKKIIFVSIVLIIVLACVAFAEQGIVIKSPRTGNAINQIGSDRVNNTPIKVVDTDIELDEKKETKTQEEVTETQTKVSWSNASKWAVEELNKAKEMEIIPSIFEGEDLTTNITRREFAHVAVKLWEKLSGQTMAAGPADPFTDTHDPEVLKAYNLEITKGTSDTTFSPDDLITREQMATMMTRAISKAGIDTSVDLENVERFADDSAFGKWYVDSIYFMSQKGIIKGIGDNKFGNSGNASKEAALLIAVRSVEAF